MLRKFWIPMLFLAVLASPTLAKPAPYDGLKLMASGEPLVDKLSDSTLVLHGFMGKYDLKLVGIYLTQHDQEVRFYMDAATWETLKADLIMTRDEWETIKPTQFKLTGEIQGFRVGQNLSTMRISMEGENDLDTKRLAFSLDGGGNTPKRVYASISLEQVKTLVAQFRRVDQAFQNSGTTAP